jgi:5-methylcytosine-specific restriction enzyme A
MELELLPFIPHQLYNRRADIHANYGGSWQGGICPSSDFPYIFIFSGHTGKQYGYDDRWENPNVFSYTGEGRIGDMKFVKGNKALRDHLINNKRVFLFEYVSKGKVKFVSEVEVFDYDYFMGFDESENERIAIRFFMKRTGLNIIVPKKPLLQLRDSLSIEKLIPTVTERQGLVTSRVGQGAYRKSIIYRWNSECPITKFNDTQILIASHIVPWKKSTDIERLDVDNGILLSPVYDALFDRHLISFENNGSIILHSKIEPSAFQKIGVTGKEKIANFSIVTFLI